MAPQKMSNRQDANIPFDVRICDAVTERNAKQTTCISGPVATWKDKTVPAYLAKARGTFAVALFG